MGIVKSVVTNELGETTAAYVLKGATRETVYRHSSSLILLIPNDENGNNNSDSNGQIKDRVNDAIPNLNPSRPSREAAIKARKLIKDLINQDLG